MSPPAGKPVTLPSLFQKWSRVFCGELSSHAESHPDRRGVGHRCAPVSAARISGPRATYRMIILASGGERALAIRSTRGWRRGRASCVDGVMPDFKAASTVDLAM